MTGAGLSCAHHMHGRLYASQVADALACSTALVAGGAVGYFRMRADAHWLSDQLAGAGLGLLSGYVLATVLYYHPFWCSFERRPAAGRATPSTTPRFTLLPLLDATTLGASFLMQN